MSSRKRPELFRAARPVAAVPTSSKPLSFATTVAIPSRNAGWSSTHRIRIRLTVFMASLPASRVSQSNTLVREDRGARKLRWKARSSQFLSPLPLPFLILS